MQLLYQYIYKLFRLYYFDAYFLVIVLTWWYWLTFKPLPTLTMKPPSQKGFLIVSLMKVKILLQKGVLGMTLKYILWWGSILGIPLHYHYSQVHSDAEWQYLLGYNLGVISVRKLLVLNRNTWNHKTVNKLFVLRLVTWMYNCLQKIIIICYLEPYCLKHLIYTIILLCIKD